MRYNNGDIHPCGVLLNEFFAYRTQEKSTFQVPMANDPTMMHNAIKWWETFGACTPNLKRLAILMLSQGSCASSCERNWSTFSLIHTNHNLITRIRETGLCLTEVTSDMINKEDDDERLLRMQNQANADNNEVNEDIIDELEDMDDAYDSA